MSRYPRRSSGPSWPPAACYNYKEVWVHPGSRWFFLMADIAGNPLVTGIATPGYDGKVKLREAETGQVTEVAPQISTGIFQADLPAGKYAVSAGGQTRTVTVLPGGTIEAPADERAGNSQAPPTQPRHFSTLLENLWEWFLGHGSTLTNADRT